MMQQSGKHKTPEAGLYLLLGKRVKHRQWLLVFCMAAFFWLESEPAMAVDVKSMRVWPSPEKVRVVFDLSDAVKYSLFTLRNPDRVVLDVRNARLDGSLVSKNLEASPINRVRYAPRRKTDLRIVLDLRRFLKPESFLLPPNSKYGHRLVVDLRGHARTHSLAHKPHKSVNSKAGGQRNLVVAIDAGHGGEDSGAVGYRKILEKDVVLAIARELHKRLKKPGYQPVLIRDGDYYVGLRQRTEIARKARADLFISIHADAFKNKEANGASVFALSKRGASSETARWIAQQENSADLVGGINVSRREGMVAKTLLDLAMTNTLRSSLDVGGKMLGAMGGISRLHKPQVEQAAFLVLKSPDIPSVLVETGFITNPADARRLANPRYQKHIARALQQGTEAYFRGHAPAGTRIAHQRASKRQSYTIRAGDTLSEIALRYRVTVASLRRANDMTADTIRVGQKLMIP
jgi:N-acetylmuramoyl-L-alanine amidase